MTNTQAPAEPAKFRGRDGSGDGYRYATVCRRRHEQSARGEDYPGDDLGFCPKCGANVLSSCPECGRRLQGMSRSLTAGRSEQATYKIHEWGFCDGYANPYPWANREEQISHLINMLDSEDMSGHDRLIVAENLQQLQQMTPGEDPERERKSWELVSKYAPPTFKAIPTVIKIVEAVRGFM
jgi:hypothetical protein